MVPVALAAIGWPLTTWNQNAALPRDVFPIAAELE